MKSMEKINTENPKILAEFKEYLILEKSKLDNLYSFFFEGIQNVSLYSTKISKRIVFSILPEFW